MFDIVLRRKHFRKTTVYSALTYIFSDAYACSVLDMPPVRVLSAGTAVFRCSLLMFLLKNSKRLLGMVSVHSWLDNCNNSLARVLR